MHLTFSFFTYRGTMAVLTLCVWKYNLLLCHINFLVSLNQSSCDTWQVHSKNELISVAVATVLGYHRLFQPSGPCGNFITVNLCKAYKFDYYYYYHIKIWYNLDKIAVNFEHNDAFQVLSVRMI